MEDNQACEQGVNPTGSIYHILFDIRALQASPLRYRPIDRYFLCLIRHLPQWLQNSSRISLFAEWGLEIPKSLDSRRDEVIYTPPFQRESLLVVELTDQASSLR